MTRFLPDEERSELEAAIRAALKDERASLVAEIKETISADLDKHFELIGLSAQTPEHRAEFRKDLEFIRKIRENDGEARWRVLVSLSKAFDGAANAIGKAILIALLAGVTALAGYGAWLKGWIVKM